MTVVARAITDTPALQAGRNCECRLLFMRNPYCGLAIDPSRQAIVLMNGLRIDFFLWSRRGWTPTRFRIQSGTPLRLQRLRATGQEEIERRHARRHSQRNRHPTTIAR